VHIHNVMSQRDTGSLNERMIERIPRE